MELEDGFVSEYTGETMAPNTHTASEVQPVIIFATVNVR